MIRSTFRSARNVAMLLAAMAMSFTMLGTSTDRAAATWPGLPHDAGVVEHYYRDHPGLVDQYGGLYFTDIGHHGKLHVLVTDSPPARPYPWEKDIANPDQLRVRSVPFSYRYIRHVQREISNDWNKPWCKGLNSIGIDIINNHVFAGFSSGKAPAGFAKHYDMRVVRVVKRGPDSGG